MDSGFVKRLLLPNSQGFNSVVDYGCGFMDYLSALPHIPVRVGIDIVKHEPCKDPNATFILGDIRTRSFAAELALMIDTIEHLQKADGLALLEHAKEIHNRIILFTPKGFWDNHEGQAAYPDNPYQEHLSGWEPDELPGFEIQVINDVGPAPQSLFAVWDRCT